MKYALLALLFAASTACAQIKISELPAASTLTGTEATMVTQGGVSKKATITQINAYTLTSTGTLSGKTISGADNTLSNVAFSALTGLPSTLAGYGITDGLLAATAASTYATIVNLALKAPIDSPTFTGTVTGPTFVGALTGNASTATSATSFSGSLVGDVIGTQGATVVGTVGAVSAANVAAGATLANAATNANTASAIVKRDGSGNFTAGTITAALDGNASTVTTNANLTGPVTSTGNATAIANGAITNAMLANGGGITIGTTTSNGTAGRILYTDGTNVQAYAVTGSGSAVLGTSPTITGLAPSAVTGTAAILGANTFTGAQKFPDGTASAPAITFTTAGSPGIYATSSRLDFAFSNSSKHTFWNDGSIYQNDTAAELKIANRVSLYGDASNALAQRASTSPQISRIYNTWTSATNYERAAIEWASNVLRIGTQKGSAGGTARDMILISDDTERVRINSAGLTVAAPGTITGDGSTITGLTQSQVSGLTTTSRPQFANVRVTHSTLTYAATTDIDLDTDGFQTVTLTGNITFTTSNRAAARSKTIRIIGDSSLRTFTFPAWTFIGAAAPASLAANKDAVLTITAFGTADTDIVAAYSAEP